MKRGTFDLLAILAVFVAYSLTIRLALHLDLSESLLGGAANTLPVVIFGAMARLVIQRQLIGRSTAFQLAGHLVLCAAFTWLSYFLLIVLLGFFVGARPDGYLVEPFTGGAAAWQSLENATTYALIAAISYLQVQPRAATVQPVLEPDDPALSRYFVKIGDELRPLDMDTVVSIGGADDYSEVRTLTGKHLVRVTLAEFGKSLDPAKYVRVHRSWIVNVHRIARAEPVGGGRLKLHMEGGHAISTSRAGAKLLQDRVI